MSSYQPEVFVENAWSANQLRFTTEEEAKRYAQDLYRRWTLTKDYRAKASEDPVNAIYDDNNRLTYIEVFKAPSTDTSAEFPSEPGTDGSEGEIHDATGRVWDGLQSKAADAPFDQQEQPTGHEWPDEDEPRAGHLTR